MDVTDIVGFVFVAALVAIIIGLYLSESPNSRPRHERDDFGLIPRCEREAVNIAARAWRKWRPEQEIRP